MTLISNRVRVAVGGVRTKGESQYRKWKAGVMKATNVALRRARLEAEFDSPVTKDEEIMLHLQQIDLPRSTDGLITDTDMAAARMFPEIANEVEFQIWSAENPVFDAYDDHYDYDPDRREQWEENYERKQKILRALGHGTYYTEPARHWVWKDATYVFVVLHDSEWDCFVKTEVAVIARSQDGFEWHVISPDDKIVATFDLMSTSPEQLIQWVQVVHRMEALS